jgi:hypothetical protein
MNMKGIVFFIFGMILTGCTSIQQDHGTVLEVPGNSLSIPESEQVAITPQIPHDDDHQEQETPQVSFFSNPNSETQTEPSSRTLPLPNKRNLFITAKAKKMSFLDYPVEAGMYAEAEDLTKEVRFDTAQLPSPVLELPQETHPIPIQEQAVASVERQPDDQILAINNTTQTEPVLQDEVTKEESTEVRQDQNSNSNFIVQPLSVSIADISDKSIELPGYGWKVTEIEQMDGSTDANNNLIRYAGGRFGRDGLNIVIEIGYTSTGMTLGILSTGDNPLSRPTIESPLLIALTRIDLQTGENERLNVVVEPEPVAVIAKESEETNLLQEPTDILPNQPEMVKIESFDNLSNLSDISQQQDKVESNQAVSVAYREESGKNQTHTSASQLPGDQILFNRARSLSEMKDLSSIREAITLYRRILQEYPLSRHYTAARAAALQLERNYILVR